MNDPRLSGMSGSSFLATPKITGRKKPDEAEAAFTALIDRLRKHAVATPPARYRCIRCFDSDAVPGGLIVVPHPRSVKLHTDSFGEICVRWIPPCRELSVACSCPTGSAKYANVNDWLREQKKATRLWSIRDYLNWLCQEFYEVFGSSEDHAAAWLEEQSPAGKAAILAAAKAGAV